MSVSGADASSYDVQEIDEYINRFKDVPPERLLMFVGEMRDFFFAHMTPEARMAFDTEQEKKRSELERALLE